MESKTPVTILQELLMKQHEVPIYTLILNGIGTHEPVFKYEVSAAGQKAVGSGKSKKEAKHDAAHQMLLVMKVVDTTVSAIPDDVTSPYEGILKDNVVGELQDFCVTNQLQLPEYELTRDEGLPHAKVFSWTCTVSSFTTEATARTKKNAKHMAAQDMLLKLKECLGDIIESRSAEWTPPQTFRIDEMDTALDEVIKKMPRNIRKVNNGQQGMNLGDVCYALTDKNMPDLSYLDSIKDLGPSWFSSQVKEDFQYIFMKIADEMQCEYSLRRLESSDQKKLVVALIVESMPMWTFVAAEDSLLQAVNTVFEDAVKFMLKMRI